MLRTFAIPFLLTGMMWADELHGQQLVFKNYSVSDGLVANPIRRVTQDSKGFLWITTWEGVSQYNGYRFTNYTTANGLSHNLINDIHESQDGKIYLAANNGKTDIIENGKITARGIFPNIIINRFYRTSNNRILAVTDTNGIYQLNASRMHKINSVHSRANFTDITEFNDSYIALSAPLEPLVILDASYQRVEKFNVTTPGIESVFTGPAGQLWLGTASGLSIVSFDGDKTVSRPPDFPSEVLPLLRYVTCLLHEKDGIVWVGTSNGLFRIKPNGSWRRYSEKDGLPSGIISCLFQDKEKNVWIGSSMGLSKVVTRNKVEIYTSEHGLGRGIRNCFPAAGDQLLIFCNDKIQQFDRARNKFKTLAEIHSSDLAVPSNQVPILHSNNKLLFYDRSKKIFIEKVHFTGPVQVFYATVLPDKIIMATGRGLLIQEPDKLIHDQNLPYRVSTMLADKRGILWIGTWQNGLYRIKTGSLPSSSATDYAGVLRDVEIRSLFEDSNGSIWVGTRYDGVFRVFETAEGLKTVQYDHRQSLNSNWINSMAEDGDGNIWLGSILGLDKLVKTKTGYQVFNFSRVNDCFQYTYNLSATGSQLWCVTTDGLVNITDDKTETLEQPPIYITNVSLGPNVYNDTIAGKEIYLDYNQNHATFEFTAPAFINEKQILYSYRLLCTGDSSWSIPANEHSVSYASLQPGNYRFEVRTIGWNGKYGTPAHFNFNINPPYWKTWWFLTAIVLVVFALLYTLYRYRIGQLMQLQKVRNRLATDLHDDIGSTLTNISILSELSKKNLGQPTEARQFLQRITEEVTASGQALDDIIWSVNARNDSMEEILARMRRYAAELFDSSNIMYQLELENAVAGKKLKMEQRRDLYLIYKEALNNIYKHAQAGTVFVKAGMNHQHFDLVITDDGKGFEISKPTHRNGLNNLRERVEKWNGKFSITSSEGKGTTIKISIPVGG